MGVEGTRNEKQTVHCVDAQALPLAPSERPHDVDTTGDCIPQCWCKAPVGADIVERLRDVGDPECRPIYGLCLEAADEIERVRARLAEYERQNYEERIERLRKDLMKYGHDEGCTCGSPKRGIHARFCALTKAKHNG